MSVGEQPVCPDCSQPVGLPGMTPEAIEFELRRHRWPQDGLGCPARPKEQP